VVSKNEPGLSTKIHEVIKTAHDKGFHVVGIDLSSSPSARIFEECDVPFVMDVSNIGSSMMHSLMRTRSLAVIDDDFNKYARAVEEMWEYIGKRFPGLFRTDWTVDGYECKPEHEQDYDRCTERVFESIDRLFGRPVAETSIRKERDNRIAEKYGVPKGCLDNYTCSDVTLKSKDNGSYLKLETMFTGGMGEAEGICDATEFLAYKCAQGARPRTYKMTEVMEMKLQHKDVDKEEQRREQTAQ